MEIATHKTLVPVHGANGRAGHLLPSAKGFRAFGQGSGGIFDSRCWRLQGLSWLPSRLKSRYVGPGRLCDGHHEIRCPQIESGFILGGIGVAVIGAD